MNETLGSPHLTDLRIRRIGVNIAAEVTGVDLRAPLTADVIEGLRLAHAEHGVLVFPRQAISSDDLKRFGRYFGNLTVHPFSTNAANQPELIVYDNKEGNPPPRTDIWHTDETFREKPPMGTILCSKIVPDLGGDTAFCNMGAAFDGLSDRLQAFISGLEAIHDFKPFRELFGNDAEGRRKLRHYEDLYPPVVHPVVRVHPVTGRKTIFVNPQFTLRIKDMEENESRWLLDRLFSVTNTLEYQYRHRWEPDTVVFWDNRLVNHAAVHDYYPARRLMERVTMSGDRPVGPIDSGERLSAIRPKVPSLIDFTDRPRRHHERD
jgi:taurine dioxygenase